MSKVEISLVNMSCFDMLKKLKNNSVDLFLIMPVKQTADIDIYK